MAPRGSRNWTYEDYVELPDDGNRYEILGGVLYVDGDIVSRHQLIVIRLWTVISRYAENSIVGKSPELRCPSLRKVK